MFVGFSESVLSPATLLWAVAGLTAVTILFGAINRRRASLTETLKGYVSEDQIKQRAAKRDDNPSNGKEN